MSHLNIQALSGAEATISSAALDTFRGTLLRPGEDGYDEARAIWNGFVDRRPALIARCADAADVQAAVRLAATHGLLVSVKGGGHNIAGNAVCDGGLMIDLSLMRSVQVDPARRVAIVEPGCTLADVDAATQAHGLATPVGINSTTGIAGLTLGGGFGWLSREHGMTIDNLRSVEIVTADGERVRASAEEHPDLFWAVRGGGGNFGVVTSFEFQLHPVGPEVLAGLIVHPLDDAPSVLRGYRTFTQSAPDKASVWIVIRKAPPLPFLPESWHGREVLVLAAFWNGDIAEGERALAPIRAVGNPIADVVGPAPYAAWQQAFDPLLAPGARNYWKTHNFAALPDGLLDVLVEQGRRLPTPHCEIFVPHHGGAMGRVDPAATAYPHRANDYSLNVHGRWTDASEDEAGLAWARETFAACAPYATGGAYVNFLTADEGDRVGAAYGANYARLADVKRRYDPENLFRMNQNVRPGAEA